MLPFRGAVNTKDLYGAVPAALAAKTPYDVKLLGIAADYGVTPVIYPSYESVGVSCADIGGNGWNATYHSVTLGATNGPVSPYTAPLYDGLVSNTELPGTFNAAANTDEYSYLIWIKNSDWTQVNLAFLFLRNASNDIRINASLNTLGLARKGGGTTRTNTLTPVSDTGWLVVGQVCSVAGGYQKGFYNRALFDTQSGATAPVAASAANLSASRLGSNQAGTGSFFFGYLAWMFWINAVLSDSDMIEAMTL